MCFSTRAPKSKKKATLVGLEKRRYLSLKSDAFFSSSYERLDRGLWTPLGISAFTIHSTSRIVSWRKSIAFSLKSPLHFHAKVHGLSLENPMDFFQLRTYNIANAYAQATKKLYWFRFYIKKRASIGALLYFCIYSCYFIPCIARASAGVAGSHPMARMRATSRSTSSALVLAVLPSA